MLAASIEGIRRAKNRMSKGFNFTERLALAVADRFFIYFADGTLDEFEDKEVRAYLADAFALHQAQRRIPDWILQSMAIRKAEMKLAQKAYLLDASFPKNLKYAELKEAVEQDEAYLHERRMRAVQAEINEPRLAAEFKRQALRKASPKTSIGKRAKKEKSRAKQHGFLHGKKIGPKEK